MIQFDFIKKCSEIQCRHNKPITHLKINNNKSQFVIQCEDECQPNEVEFIRIKKLHQLITNYLEVWKKQNESIERFCSEFAQMIQNIIERVNGIKIKFSTFQSGINKLFQHDSLIKILQKQNSEAFTIESIGKFKQEISQYLSYQENEWVIIKNRLKLKNQIQPVDIDQNQLKSFEQVRVSYGNFEVFAKSLLNVINLKELEIQLDKFQMNKSQRMRCVEAICQLVENTWFNQIAVGDLMPMEREKFQEPHKLVASNPVVQVLLKQLLKLSRVSHKFVLCSSNAAQLLVQGGIKFDGMNLSGLKISNINLNGASFQQTNLTDSQMKQVSIVNANFSHANLKNVSWEQIESSELANLKGHTGEVCSVSFSSTSNSLMASASDDKVIRLWDVLTGKQINQLTGHKDRVQAVTFSPDGSTIASGSADQTVILWEVKSGIQIRQIDKNLGHVYSIVYSPDGSMLATSSDDYIVRLWNSNELDSPRQLKGHLDSVWSVAFSPDSEMLASASSDETVRLWTIMSGKELHIFQGHSGIVYAVAFSLDGETLATGGGKNDSQAQDDSKIILWNVKKRTEKGRLDGHKNSISSIVFSPNNPLIVASSSVDETIRLWDINTEKEILSLQGHTSAVYSVGFSPDGQILASGSADSRVRLWNIKGSIHGIQMELCECHLQPLKFSTSGQILASISDDFSIRLWDAQGKMELLKLSGHKQKILTAAFSHDDQMLATGSGNSEDCSVRLWNLRRGKLIHQLEGHSGIVYIVCFSPNGRFLTSCGGNHLKVQVADCTIRLWDIKSGKEILSSKINRSVQILAFTTDGTQVSIQFQDKTTQHWHLSSGKLVTGKEFMKPLGQQNENNMIKQQKTITKYTSETAARAAITSCYKNLRMESLFEL